MTSVRPDSLLPTPTGWARAGELRPGAFVFDATGRPVRVVVANQEVPKRAISVKMVMEPVVVSEDHDAVIGLPWYGNWIGPKNLQAERDRRLVRPLSPVKRIVLQLPDIELPLNPWAYGYWRILHLPDGTIAVPSAHEDAAASYLESVGLPVAHVFRDGGFTYLTSPDMATALDKIGDHDGLAPEYLRAGTSQRRAALTGIVDARQRYMNGVTIEGPRPIILDAADLAMSLGLRASTPNRGIARLRMSPHDVPMMLRQSELDEFMHGPNRPGYRLEVPYMIRNAREVSSGDFVQIKTEVGSYLLSQAMLPVRDY